MADQTLGFGTGGGVSVGRSDDLVGCYGNAVVQPTMTVTVGTDIATVILELAEIRAALVGFGLIDA